MRAGALAAALAGLLAGCSLVAGPTAAPPPARLTTDTSSPAPRAPSSSAPTPPGSATSPARVQVSATGWSLPESLAREVVVGHGRRVVVAGGLVAGDRSTAATYRLDLGNGLVTRLPALAVAVHDASGVRLHGQALVVGGGNATEQSAVQELAPHGGWSVVGHLPQSRSDLVATLAGGRCVVVGGYDGVTTQASVLASGDGRSFSVVGRLPVPVRYPAVVTAGHAVWVLGGERDGSMVDAVQRLDLATGRVRVVGRLPLALGHAAAFWMDGRILLAGGRTSSTSMTAGLWWVDPSTGAVTRAGQLPYAVSDAGAYAAGDTAYLLGGETPSLTGRVLRLTLPSSG